MPVHNGMPYLPLAVNSILSQSFTDFEFIIVDDCSHDDTPRYLKSITDERIVLVILPENKGVTGALQEGMKCVNGKYVARLDADDIAKPHRLQTQVDFLESNPKIGLLGSSIELIDASGKLLSHVNLAKDDIEIRWRFLVKNPFFHSTVMFRHDLLGKHNLGYTLKHGEDYHLWVEMMRFCKGAISAEELIQYRTHQQSWTTTKGKEQERAFDEINGQILERYIPGLRKKIDVPNFVEWMRSPVRIRHNQTLFKDTYILLVNSFAETELDNNVRRTFIESKLRHVRDNSIWMKLKSVLNGKAHE